MKRNVVTIKEMLDKQLGKKLTLKANYGRKRIVEHIGTLAETYPAVFVVELEEEGANCERLSFSYADVLTKGVELFFE